MKWTCMHGHTGRLYFGCFVQHGIVLIVISKGLHIFSLKVPEPTQSVRYLGETRRAMYFIILYLPFNYSNRFTSKVLGPPDLTKPFKEMLTSSAKR